MPNHLTVIDADAHVIETEHTWDYLEPSEQKFRPRLFYSPDDATRQYWVIDDKIGDSAFRPCPSGNSGSFAQRAGRNFETPQAARELDDVELRLKHMDELGIDIQVLHNTFWIEQITHPTRGRDGPVLELESLARRCQQEEQRPASLFVRRPGHEHRRSHCADQVRQGERRSGGLHASFRRRTASQRPLFLSHLPNRRRSRLGDRHSHCQWQSRKLRSLSLSSRGTLRPVSRAHGDRVL